MLYALLLAGAIARVTSAVGDGAIAIQMAHEYLRQPSLGPGLRAPTSDPLGRDSIATGEGDLTS